MSIRLGVSVASVYDDDGFLGIQCDVFGEKDAGVPPFQALHPYGFQGRPLDQSADGSGANAFYWEDGDESHCIALTDSRSNEYLPQLTHGSSIQYAAFGGFVQLDTLTETLTVYTPYESGAHAHVLTMGVDGNGDPYVGIVHGDGMAILMLNEKTVVKNAAGDAYIELTSDGITLNGNVKAVGGMDVGGGTALPLILEPTFAAWWTVLSAAVTAQGATPLTGASLGAVLTAASAGITATGSTLLKGI